MIIKINETQFITREITTKKDFSGNDYEIIKDSMPWTLEQKQTEIDSLVERQGALADKLVIATAEKQKALELNN